MGSFIASQNSKFSSEIVRKILHKVKSASVPAGCFSFSGFTEFCHRSNDKRIRVFVGEYNEYHR
jgi:hypothetical protein